MTLIPAAQSESRRDQSAISLEFSFIDAKEVAQFESSPIDTESSPQPWSRDGRKTDCVDVGLNTRRQQRAIVIRGGSWNKIGNGLASKLKAKQGLNGLPPLETDSG